MDANCFNLSLKDNRRLANDFGEIKTQELMNKYFPDYNPDYNQFISNKDIINELNLKNLSQSNNILGTTYKKQISNAQLTNLKNKISIKNNQLNKQGESIVYKLYNVKQLGESDNYTWSIREIKGKLNVQDKIERAKARGQFQQAKDLEQGDQLKLNEPSFEKLKIDQLKKFFNQFGFDFKEGDSSTDLLNKIIYVNKNNNSLFINNSVKALSQLLLANTNIDFSKLESLIENTEEFKQLLNNSSDYIKNTHKFLKEGNRIPMAEWMLYIKDYNKIKNTVLEKYITESLLDNNVSTGLHKLINDFIQWFKNLFNTSTNLKQITDALIQQVLINQKEVIVNSKDLINKEKVSLDKALQETEHGKNIIKTFGKFGLILTGSVSVSEQGSVFRKTGKLLHDIDWVVPKGFDKDFISELLINFPGAKLVRAFDSPGYYTQTYIVPPKGYTVSNLTFFKPETYGENKYIASYDVLDKNGKIVSNYRRYYDVKASGKVVENKEVYNEGLQNVDKNLEAVSVDFFQNKEDLKYEPYTVNVEGVNLKLSNWRSSFTEKLKYGRAKDLLDYALFVPDTLSQKENNQLKLFQLSAQPKSQIKPGVSELFESNPELANIGTQEQYSAYLDTIFPDSKVKDIVYHGANEPIETGKFIKRAGATGNAIWFSGSKRYATNVMNNAPQSESLLGRKLRGAPTMYSVLLNIKNPAHFYESTGAILAQSPERFIEGKIEEYRLHGNKQYNKNVNDGALFHHPNSKKPETSDSAEQVVVFEPEQIHILGSKQDVEGFKEFVDKTPQQTLFQLQPEQTDSKEIIEQIDKNLNDYIKNNNINIEFKDQVLDSNGNDVVAFYDGVKKVIEINEGKRDSKTLPEELAHHLHLALGKDHILVKRAFNLLNRVDYKAMLGQEYVDLYKNNTDLLKFEILGKLTAAAVRGEKIPLQMNTIEGNKLWDTIKRMINAVIKLFKPDVNVQKELDNLSNQFADMLKSGVKVDSEKSINAKLYQTNKDLINLSSKIKPAYVYYTTLSTALKKKQKQFSALSEEYKIIQNQINTIDISLRELIQNENELPLINLVEETITTVAQNINDFEINYSKGIMPSEKNIIEAVEILKKFSGFPGTESKINALKARLINFIKPYLANKASEVLGKPVTEEDISAVTSDINVLEKNFGTLARTEFTLSRMLGLLIKQKQNTIERENKQAFEQVQAATNKLKDWAASKGMSLEQAFDVLQQEYRGTRILTKEYTSEFYKLINDTYKLDPEKAKEARAKIAIWDAANKKWIPKSTKYNNPNYQLIHKKGNEDLLNYYNFFKDQIQKISDNTLPIELDDYFIPNVYEETLLDILKTEDAVGDKLKDSVIHILEFNPFEKMGTVDKQMDVIYDADLIGDKIPLKYIQALPEDKKSKNLSAALLKFMYFANSYNHMNEILPIANLVQETITDPDTSKILQYGNPNLNVAAKSNIVDMVKTIKEMQILGKMRKENEMFNVLGYKLNYGKLIDFGLQYTSKIRLGLNPFAALANVVIGNLGNIIEAAGGKYFTLSEYFSALGTFTTEAKKVDGLINLFNPLMEMDDYENLKKLGVGSKEYREKINGLLYAPTRMGEKQMQTTTMIAILKHKKVDIKDKKGNVTGSISMLDAFDSNGKWDTAKMGYELNEQEINKITNRVHGVNQMIHGRYSAKDAAAMQQYAMYRALMQFKKWIPAAVEQRFMARRYDPLLDEETEGRYWAYAKGLRLMMAKLKNDAKKIEENKFTELDWYNMRRNAMEVLMIGLMFGLTTFLKAGDDDDELKRNASYKTYMRLLNSVSGDLMQWYLPGTFLDKAMVLPVTKTLRSLERTIQYTPYMFGDYTSDASGTYEAGERKDENKFWSNFFNNVPFGSTTADMYRTWFKDDVSYIPRNR